MTVGYDPTCFSSLLTLVAIDSCFIVIFSCWKTRNVISDDRQDSRQQSPVVEAGHVRIRRIPWHTTQETPSGVQHRRTDLMRSRRMCSHTNLSSSIATKLSSVSSMKTHPITNYACPANEKRLNPDDVTILIRPKFHISMIYVAECKYKL